MSSQLTNPFTSDNITPHPDVDTIKRRYLTEFEPCAKRVVIASSRYGRDDFNCEVIVDAADLLPWAAHLASGSSNMDAYHEAAVLAFPEWLRHANKHLDTQSYLPGEFLDIVQAHCYDFIVNRHATVVCDHCQAVFQDVQRRPLDGAATARKHVSEEQWLCPNGHVIYHGNQFIDSA